MEMYVVLIFSTIQLDMYSLFLASTAAFWILE